MTQKILVIGSHGQLGRDLCTRLPGEVIAATREHVDLTNPDSFEFLRSTKPDVVINCAAYNFVDRAETEADAAFAVNTWGVQRLAQVCRDIDALLVHFSTDYVFGSDRQRTTPYRENDIPGPLSVYGLSKLSGEYVIQANCPRHLIIRTCGLYGVWGSGGKGGNFVETMLRLASQDKPIRVVFDQILTPSYTVDVAKNVTDLLAEKRTGMYHVTNAGQCSWFEFAREIFRLSDLSVDVMPIRSAEFGTAAERPAFSVLTNRLSSEGIAAPRPWQEALTAYLTERNQRKESHVNERTGNL